MAWANTTACFATNYDEDALVALEEPEEPEELEDPEDLKEMEEPRGLGELEDLRELEELRNLEKLLQQLQLQQPIYSKLGRGKLLPEEYLLRKLLQCSKPVHSGPSQQRLRDFQSHTTWMLGVDLAIHW